MTITAYLLLNYLRCRRFAALDRQAVYRKTNGSAKDIPTLEMLSVQNNYQLIGYEDEEAESFDPKALHQESAKESIRRLKDHAAKTLKARFPEKQMREHVVLRHPFEPAYPIETTFDIVVETTKEAWYFTVAAMTDGSLQKKTFSVNGADWPLFVADADHFHRMHTISLSDRVNTNFEDKLAKLRDRHDDIGRHLYDLAFKAFLVDKTNQAKEARFFLVTLNADYVYDGRKEHGNPVYAADLIKIYDFTELAVSMRDDVRADLYRTINLIELDDDSPVPLVKQECQRSSPFQCPFVEYCYEGIPKKNSIFAYINNHLGFREGPTKNDVFHDTYDLLNEGYVDMLDVPIAWLQREKNLMQRYCVENQTTFVNQKKIKTMLDTLKYPLYYLDFEANPAMLPKHKGEWPYCQSVFQFSIHIESDLGKCAIDDPASHVEYLIAQEGDHRKELVEALLKAIPEGDSSIIVYNRTFEKNRLLELAALFPEHRTRLLELERRLFDLLKVIKNDARFFLDLGYPKDQADQYHYYHPELSGSYSLKRVLPIFAGDAYSALPIHSGLAAYLRYSAMHSEPKDVQETTKRQLLDYCRQDTYAMVEILHGLKELLV